MTAGRPPMPVKLKKINGSYNSTRDKDKDTVNFNEFKPGGERPTGLINGAEVIFDAMVDELSKINLLQTVDILPLIGYCNEMKQYIECKQIVEREGLTYKHPKLGTVVARPEVKMAKESLDQAMRIASQFGFTPSSRTRLKFNAETKEEDPFADV